MDDNQVTQDGIEMQLAGGIPDDAGTPRAAAYGTLAVSGIEYRWRVRLIRRGGAWRHDTEYEEDTA